MPAQLDGQFRARVGPRLVFDWFLAIQIASLRVCQFHSLASCLPSLCTCPPSFSSFLIPIHLLYISIHPFQLCPYRSGFFPSPCISSNSVHIFFFFSCRSIFLSSVTIRHPGNSPIPYVKTILFSSSMLTSQVINNVFYLPRLICSRKLRSDHYGFAYADDYGESRIYLRR